MTKRKALVPLDGSSMALELMRFTFEHARKNHIDWIDFFHVWERSSLYNPWAEKDENAGPLTEDLFRRQFARLVEDLHVANGPLDIPHDLIITYGIPYEEIINRAEKEPYWIIILGHKGTSNIERFFMGHVAAKVVRHAPCHVLIFRP